MFIGKWTKCKISIVDRSFIHFTVSITAHQDQPNEEIKNVSSR